MRTHFLAWTSTCFPNETYEIELLQSQVPPCSKNKTADTLLLIQNILHGGGVFIKRNAIFPNFFRGQSASELQVDFLQLDDLGMLLIQQGSFCIVGTSASNLDSLRHGHVDCKLLSEHFISSCVAKCGCGAENTVPLFFVTDQHPSLHHRSGPESALGIIRGDTHPLILQQ